MSGKIEKLEKIMEEICNKIRIQEGIDITMTENPARIYFTFECSGDGFYLNTTGTSMENVCKVPNGIAYEHGLQRDKSNEKYKSGGRVALGFKLKPIRR